MISERPGDITGISMNFSLAEDFAMIALERYPGN